MISARVVVWSRVRQGSPDAIGARRGDADVPTTYPDPVPVAAETPPDPYAGHVFAFRGRRGDLIKLLWSDGDGMCLLTKRLERGRFIWPQADSGSVMLSVAQLSMLLEGIDWRRPERTWQPRAAA